MEGRFCVADTPRRALPPFPHLDKLRKEAKARLSEMRARLPSARLADAQFLLAREYGFANWTALKSEVDKRADSTGAAEIRNVRARGALHRAQMRSANDEENDPQSPTPFLRIAITGIVGVGLVALLGMATVFFGSAGGAEGFLAIARGLAGSR